MVNRIEIDGVDKTGKDLIVGYVDRLSKRRYVVHARGLLSMVTYNEIYERGYDFTQEIENNKDTLIVYLEADEKDLEIRHKLSNEPKIDIGRDLKAFRENVERLKDKGLQIMEFSTSCHTPFEIALDILDYVESHNTKIGGN